MQNPSTYGYDVIFKGLGGVPGRMTWDGSRGLIFKIPEGSAQQLMDMLHRTGVVVPHPGEPTVAPVNVEGAPALPIRDSQTADSLQRAEATAVAAREQAEATGLPVVTAVQQPAEPDMSPDAVLARSQHGYAHQGTPSLETPTSAAAAPAMSADTAIAALDWIPARTRTALTNAGLMTAGAAFAQSNADLLKLKGVGAGFIDGQAPKIAELRAALGIQVPDAASTAPPIPNPVPEPAPQPVTQAPAQVVTENGPGPYATMHEGIAVVSKRGFGPAEPGYLITRQDGLRVRFNADHSEVTRLPGDPPAAAAAMPAMGGLAGATAVAPPVQQVAPQPVAQAPAPVTQTQATLGGGLMGAAAVAPQQPVAPPVQQQASVTPITAAAAPTSQLPPDVHAKVFGAHTVASAIQALAQHGMGAEEVVAFLTANVESLPFKATMNVAQLPTMVPAIFRISSAS